MGETIPLYRPVKAGTDLIRESGFQASPPGLPHQPIFYPVLSRACAERIARDWNTRDAASGYVGYVACFEVDAAFLRWYAVRQVGDSTHREYWIPEEDLDELNRHIVGGIEVVAAVPTSRSEPAP